MSAATTGGTLRHPPSREAAALATPRSKREGHRTLRVRAVDVGCRALLRISGPVDVVTTPALGEALQPLCRRGQWLILDLRSAEYIETPGLRLLMTVRHELQASGGQVCLVVEPGSRVERTLRLVELDQKVPVLHSVREAWSGGPKLEAGGAEGGKR